MGNNHCAEQSGRRAFYSTPNGAPTYTYTHTLAITTKVIRYNLLNQNLTKGTSLKTQQYMQVYKCKIFVLDQPAILFRIYLISYTEIRKLLFLYRPSSNY